MFGEDYQNVLTYTSIFFLTTPVIMHAHFWEQTARLAVEAVI